MLSIIWNDFGCFQVQRIQVRTDSHHIVGRKMHMGDAGCTHLAVLREGGLSVRLAYARACLLACRLVWTFGRGQDPAKSEG